MSATASYQRSAQAIAVVTGIEVSRGTQQRLVHRQTFELPVVEPSVEEMSIDGGKVRIRTPKGEICRWQDYKAVNLHGYCQEAFLQENERLVEWVNGQALATPLRCLGDGHDGSGICLLLLLPAANDRRFSTGFIWSKIFIKLGVHSNR